MNDEIPDIFVTRELIKCQKAFNELQDEVDLSFWEGFDACLEMVFNTVDNALYEEQRQDFKDELLEEAELYKKDG